MPALTELELTFENHEGVDIPAKYIARFSVCGITDCLRATGEGTEEAIEVFKERCAEKIYIKVSKAAKGKIFSHFYKSTSRGEELFARLEKFSDAAVISLKYADGTAEELWVPWKDAPYDNNALQTSHVDDDGNLIIKIGDFGD